MIDYQTFKLMHRHDDDDWAPMVEDTGDHHGPAGHDIERALLRHGRLFSCSRCADQVVVEPADQEAAKDR